MRLGSAVTAHSFVIDEQDAEDDQALSAYQLVLDEMADAAARVLPDLIFSLLLTNPTMADNVPLFHTNHANLGTGGASALSATSLPTALQAMGGQVLRDEDGNAIHINPRPMALLVPPALAHTARTLARAIQLDDGRDLEVRVESRLGPAGLIDPRTGEAVAGSNANWLLVASPATPSLVVGSLFGQLRPRVRQFALTGGQWGQAWDVNIDVGAAIADWRGLYFSAGA